MRLVVVLVLPCVIGFALAYFMVWWAVLAILIVVMAWLALDTREARPAYGTSGHIGAKLMISSMLVPGMLAMFIAGLYFNWALVMSSSHYGLEAFKHLLR